MASLSHINVLLLNFCGLLSKLAERLTSFPPLVISCIQNYVQATENRFLHSFQQQFCSISSSMSFIRRSLILLLPIRMCRQISSIKQIIKIKLFVYLNNTRILSCTHYSKSLQVLSCILKIMFRLNKLCYFGFSVYRGLDEDCSIVW